MFEHISKHPLTSMSMKLSWIAVLPLAALLALGQPPAVSSADQAQDAVIVREPMRKPIVWGASSAFRLQYDVLHWGGEPQVQVDPDLLERNRQARDDSLERAHQQLIERTRLAQQNQNGMRLSQAQ